MTRDLQVRPATTEDRAWIHELRHRVYAEELGQHAVDPSGRLSDGLDGDNVYLVVAHGDERAGFVSLTPPWVGRYGLDKYLTRHELPVLSQNDVVEVRILTVEPGWRDTGIATLLMYAALRWTASRGGRTIAAMGRSDLLPMYEAVGLRPVGRTVSSGSVDFEVMVADVAAAMRAALAHRRDEIEQLQQVVDWRLDADFVPRADGCEHGGASFGAIGSDFSTLERREDVVAADVLDAWFPPSPEVVEALGTDPSWVSRTSPPTEADGLLAQVSRTRGLPASSLALGAGSSDLIFRAFGRWLTPDSRVLVTDPVYGEYAHVTADVVGCQVDRFALRREDGWRIDLDRLASVVARGRYDLVVVVNPNNPTGAHVPGTDLAAVVDAAPAGTRWWVDEAYVGYVGLDQSLAPFAATRDDVVVCTSLSKMYALSGLRAAFAVSGPTTAAALRRWTPPWGVSLPAQIAAVAALRSTGHYQAQWDRTHVLRRDLAADLQRLGDDVVVEESVANWLAITLPHEGPSAADVVRGCREHDVYLRDLSPLSPAYEGRTVRVAVRDVEENRRIVDACAAVLGVAVR